MNALLFAAAAGFANVTAMGLLWLFVWLVIVALIFYAAWWLVGYLSPPEPFSKILRALVALAAFVIVVYILIGLLGSPFPGGGAP